MRQLWTARLEELGYTVTAGGRGQRGVWLAKAGLCQWWPSVSAAMRAAAWGELVQVKR